jgi:hypothetical protein
MVPTNKLLGIFGCFYVTCPSGKIFYNLVNQRKESRKMSEKLKYVKLERYGEFIFFPIILDHSLFKHLDPVSAGVCWFGDKGICSGDFHSL